MDSVADRRLVFASVVKSEFALMAAAIFGDVAPKIVRLEVAGHKQWCLCAILLEYVDVSVEGVRVHFAPRPSRDTFRVVVDEVVRVDLDADEDLIAELSEELLRLLFLECVRWRPRVSSQDRRVTAALGPRVPHLIVKAHTLSCRLVSYASVLFQTTVRSLLRIVREDFCRDRRLCVVLPDFKKRSSLLEYMFPRHRASLHDSSIAALDMLLVELGVAERDGFENVVTLMVIVESGG